MSDSTIYLLKNIFDRAKFDSLPRDPFMSPPMFGFFFGGGGTKHMLYALPVISSF